MRIKHQTQPCPTSCVSACFAMLLDRPVEDVRAELHEDFHACRVTLRQALERYEVPFTAFCSVDNPDLGEEGAYLITVPSLNITGGLHQCILEIDDDGYQIIDPVKGRDGRRYYVNRGGVQNDLETELGGYITNAFIPASYLERGQ